MAGRRRRKKKRRLIRAAAIVCMLGIIAAAGMALRGLPEILMTAEETVNMVSRQQVEFPELTVTVEEVAGDFYYQQLSEKEQTVYRELLQGAGNMEECIRLHAGQEDDTAKVYEYLLYDRPELFWCDGSSRMTVYGEYTEFYPGYTCTASEKEERQAQIDKASETCLDGIGEEASAYDRIRYIYEYLVGTVDYNAGAPDNQNIYSALVGRESVCAGYSRAAQYLLGKLGIPCIYVTGRVEGQGAHAWNIVKCGENYYQMDVTFGDPVFLEMEEGGNQPEGSINYDYLCCTDGELFTTHIQDDFVPYPACTADDLNYYRINGMYYEGYDAQEILNAMNHSIYAGEASFTCKFSDSAAYGSAREGIIDDLLPKAAGNLASYYSLSRVRYTYVEDAQHCRLTVFWDYSEQQ